MKAKAFILVLLTACLVIVVAVIVILNTNWYSSSDPQSTPITEFAQDIRDNIFAQASNDSIQNEVLDMLVGLDGDARKTYVWPNIENLLHKTPDIMSPEEYVALLQLVQGMTEINAYGGLDVDFDALIRFVRSGYSVNVTEKAPLPSAFLGIECEYMITPALATVCALYKEWVTNVRVVSKSHVFSLGIPQGENKKLLNQLNAEVLQAAMLDAILTYGNNREQYKGISLLRTPGHIKRITQIKSDQSPYITYDQDEERHLIHIEATQIVLYSANRSLLSSVGKVLDRITALTYQNKTPENLAKFEEAALLYELVDAYGLKGSMSAVNNTMRIIPIFDETELQIRVHSYIYTCREGGLDRPANSNHQDITLSELMEQYYKDYGSDLRVDYVKWWQDLWDSHAYRAHLNDVYLDYMITHHEFIGKTLEELTPDQINKLHEKVKNPDYILNLGEAP